MEIQINISVGELIDKITILQIKKEKITNLEKVKKVSFELELLENSLNSFKTSKTEELRNLMNELKRINQKLPFLFKKNRYTSIKSAPSIAI